MKLNLSEGFPPFNIKKIQEIGFEFFQNSKDPSQIMADLSNKMSEYEGSEDKLLNWLDLFSFYRIAEKDTSLYNSIKALIESSFDVEDIDDDLDEALADYIIRQVNFERGVLQTQMFQIGKDYLDQYPEETYGTLGLYDAHTNQAQARELLESHNQYVGRNSWIKLYFIYQSLPKKSGVIAVQISNLFYSYFYEPMPKTIEALDLDSYTQEDIDDYELVAISDLPEENNPESALRGKIYIADNGHYIVRDPAGTLQQDDLEAPIDLNLLDEPTEKDKVLDFTSKKGHTRICSSKVMDEVKKAEEAELRRQVDEIFSKQQVNLNILEETGIFWANRSRYLRIVVTGGATIFVPVASGIFLTSNLYALLTLGAVLGGGLFVLEMVGHTGLKISRAPDDFIKLLKDEFVALGLSAKEISRAAQFLSSEVQHLSSVAKKNQFQLEKLEQENKKLSEENMRFSHENNKLANQIEQFKLQLVYLKEAQDVFLKNIADHDSIKKDLNHILTSSETILNEAKLDFIEKNKTLTEQNEQFKVTVAELSKQVDTLSEKLAVLSEHDEQLQMHDTNLREIAAEFRRIAQNSHSSTHDLETFNQMLKQIVAKTNIETTVTVPTEEESEYVKQIVNYHQLRLEQDHTSELDKTVGLA